jgi:CHAT domain-containing protein
LLEPALSTVEALRADTPRQDIRMDYFAFRQDYYALALDLLWELHRRAPQAGYDAVAFGVRERRAARELRRQIGMQALPASPVQDAGLVDDLRRLADQYRIDGNRTGERVDGEQQQALESLLARWYRAQEPPATSSTLAPVATSPRALTADSLLLAYALGEERSYLWVLSAETQEWVALPGRREIEALAEDFGREILNLRQRRQDRRVKLGRQLSGLLLAPVAGHLRNQRLVLILDGALAAVPFAALPLPGDPSADNDAETFLIERHEIVSLPSLGILEALRRRAEARPPLRGYAVFADPVFDPRDDRLGDGSGEIASSTEGPWAELQRSEEALGASYRQRLEGTAQEAKAIAAITGLSTLMVTGLEARRETLLEKAPAGFAVLHLATHALLHPEAELSGVVLSLVDAAGHPQDGFVRAFEISQLSLPADLVVLSACETGLGEQIPGEGTLSLTWAFLNAGATRVIDSLWRVSDQRSADLMEFFYRAHVQRGLSPTAALQDAQRQMLARPGSLPYDWAGFRLQGDWRPIENPE